MDDTKFNYLLENFSGIGVILEKEDGSIVRYFYQNFESATDGIERAISQIKPYLDFRIYKKVIFVESSKCFKGV